MSAKEIKRLSRLAASARSRLLRKIMDDMVQVAERRGYEKVYLGVYETTVTKGGDVRTSLEIDRLDRLICDEIHPGGVHAMWIRGKGWIPKEVYPSR